MVGLRMHDLNTCTGFFKRVPVGLSPSPTFKLFMIFNYTDPQNRKQTFLTTKPKKYGEWSYKFHFWVIMLYRYQVLWLYLLNPTYRCYCHTYVVGQRPRSLMACSLDFQPTFSVFEGHGRLSRDCDSPFPNNIYSVYHQLILKGKNSPDKKISHMLSMS